MKGTTLHNGTVLVDELIAEHGSHMALGVEHRAGTNV